MRKTLERVRLFSGEVPPPFARYLIIILYVTTKQTANPMVFEYYSPLLQHDILYPAHFIPFPYQYKLVLDRAPSFRSVRDTWWYTGKSNLVEFKFGQIWSNSNLVKFGRIQIWSNLVEFKFGRIWSNSNLVEFGRIQIWSNLVEFKFGRICAVPDTDCTVPMGLYPGTDQYCYGNSIKCAGYSVSCYNRVLQQDLIIGLPIYQVQIL